jgi:hypothetical protein
MHPFFCFKAGGLLKLNLLRHLGERSMQQMNDWSRWPLTQVAALPPCTAENRVPPSAGLDWSGWITPFILLTTTYHE